MNIEKQIVQIHLTIGQIALSKVDMITMFIRQEPFS